jgi:energy-converting hydrogenase Eha subunit F
MAQVKKRKLSGSTDGRQILVGATGSPGTLVHTAVASTAAGTWDEIWLYAATLDTVDRLITVQLGGTSLPNDAFNVLIPKDSGRVLVLDGAILQNGTIVRVYATAVSVVVLSGFVNQMSD